MTTTVEQHTHSCQYSSNGASWGDFSNLVIGFVTHHAIDADRGTVEISCTEYPSGLAENDYLVCYIDGDLVFNGRVARPARGYYVETGTTIYGEDVAANLANPWGGEGTDPELDELFNRVYESQTDGAIITNLCEAMAIPISLHDIEDSGWTMGTIYPVTCRVGQTPWSIIREIDELAFYWTASRNNGAVTRRPLSCGSADFSAEEGVNIISASRSPLGTESIKNRWIVYGFEYQGATIGGLGVGDYREDNDNIPDPPKSRTETKRSNFVEDDAKALAIATDGVQHTNFPYDETNLVLLGDTGITIGQTVEITSDELDHAGDNRLTHTIEHHYGVSVGYEVHIKAIRPTETI